MKSGSCRNRARSAALRKILKILCKAYRFRPEMKWLMRGKTLRVTMARGSDKPHAD